MQADLSDAWDALTIAVECVYVRFDCAISLSVRLRMEPVTSKHRLIELSYPWAYVPAAPVQYYIIANAAEIAG